MYAIIETGGKQYRVEKNEVLFVEKLDAAEGKVTFDKVLAVNNDKTLKVGTPYVKNASVVAEILKNGKSKKITVFTYKPKKGSARKMGHRQPYSKIEILEINVAAPKKATEDAQVEAPAEVPAEAPVEVKAEETVKKAAPKKPASTAAKKPAAKKAEAEAEPKTEE